MKVHSDCVPCLMKRVLFQARLLDNGTEFDAVTVALKTYAKNISRGQNSARLATAVHRSAYDAMGVIDPYFELKVRADEVAERYIGRLEEFVNKSDDRFTAAVRVSIIGNIMDFGSGIAIDDPDDFENHFEELLQQGIGLDETERVKKIVEDAGTVIYMFDNCGESQFDKILIRELKRMGKRVVGVVRGQAILNDVTLKDALRIGLDKEVDLLLTSNAFSIGVDMKKIGDDLKYEISQASIILAKGMANYESLSDEKLSIPIAYLLRSKCIPVSRCLDVKIGTNVVKLQE